MAGDHDDQVLGPRQGWSIVEVPVNYRPRLGG